MADNLDPEIQRQLNESMQNMKDSINSMVPAIVLMTHAVKEQIAANKGLTLSEKDGKNVLEDFLKAQMADTVATKAAAKAKQEEEKIIQELNAAYLKGKNGLTSFGAALFSTEKGMSKYSEGVSSVGSAAWQAGTQFGILGMVVGGAINVFTKLFGAVMKYNDDVLKAADEFTKFGVAGTLTTNELAKLGARAGYSSQDLEKFSGHFKKLGPDLLALGSSATQGSKAFADLSAVGNDLLMQYSRLGISQEELNANQAQYVKLQVASGLQITEQMKRDGSLRRASIEYTNNLLELSALTGQDVEEIKKKQEANRNELTIQLRLADLQDKEIKLREEFSRTGNKTLKEEADRLQLEQQNIGKLQDVAMSIFGAGKQMDGFNSMLATGNFNELSAGFASGVPGILEFIKAVKEGKKSPAELTVFMADATDKTRKMVGEAVIQSKEIGDAFAISSDSVKNSARFRGKSEKEILEIVEAEKKQRADMAKGLTDATKNARAQQEATERALRLTQDGFIKMIQGPITKAFEWFQKALMAAAKALARVAKIFRPDLFDDIHDFLATPEELKEEQKKNAEAIAKLDKQILDNMAGVAEGRSPEEMSVTNKQLDRLRDEQRKLERRNAAIQQNIESKKQFDAASAATYGGPQQPSTPNKQPSTLNQQPSTPSSGTMVKVGTGVAGTKQDPLAKLNFGGSRGERTGGGDVDQKLIDLANKINETYPGSIFTAMNDEFHQRERKGSKHTMGKALDFAVGKPPKNAEEADEIAKQLKEMGASVVRDEYFRQYDPKKSTNKHFHVEVAHAGGFFKSPNLQEFPVLIKSNETVLTEDMVSNLRSKLNDVQKTPVSNVLPEATTPVTTKINETPNFDFSILAQLLDGLGSKMDNVIDVLSNSYTVQDELLKYSRV